MADSIDSILQELDAGYNPARQAINDRLGQLQPQADAQIQGLKQQQTNAFQDITNGARDRGMGFSGIPIDEQAKYTGGTFLPAVANVQKSVQDGRNSLVDALNNTNIDQRKTAYGIRDAQLTREQAAADAAAARDAAVRAAQASNAGASGLAGLFGGGSTGGAGGPIGGSLAGGRTVQQADADVRGLINSNNGSRLISEIGAIQKSASYGNTYDQAKLQMLQRYVPGFFTKAAGGTQGQMMLNSNYIQRLRDAGQLKFKV